VFRLSTTGRLRGSECSILQLLLRSAVERDCGAVGPAWRTEAAGVGREPREGSSSPNSVGYSSRNPPDREPGPREDPPRPAVPSLPPDAYPGSVLISILVSIPTGVRVSRRSLPLRLACSWPSAPAVRPHRCPRRGGSPRDSFSRPRHCSRSRTLLIEPSFPETGSPRGGSHGRGVPRWQATRASRATPGVSASNEPLSLRDAPWVAPRQACAHRG